MGFSALSCKFSVLSALLLPILRVFWGGGRRWELYLDGEGASSSTLTSQLLGPECDLAWVAGESKPLLDYICDAG